MDRGLWIARDGKLYGCEETGSGSVGQYAAYPGNCSVEVELEWRVLDDEDISTERLAEAEEELRKLAFPLVAAVSEPA